MNSGNIKWNVSITATIKSEKNNKEDIDELNDIIESIRKYNGDVKPSAKKLIGKKKDRGIKRRIDKGIKIKSTSQGTKISLDFNSSLRSPYICNDAFEGIKNIKKWFTVVTEDRDWDHQFIINTLRFKIHNTCEYIKKTQRHLNWERDVKYMTIALNLIKKIWGEDYNFDITTYDSEYTDYHVSKHNWIPNTDDEIKEMEDEMGEDPIDLKGSTRMEITEVSENFDEFFAKNKLTHKKAIEYLSVKGGWNDPESKFTQALVISRLKHKKAVKLLFRILELHLESWWD